MNAAVFPHVDVEGAIEKLGATAKRIKAERDEFEAVLRDLRLGAMMMLEPKFLGMPSWVEGYIKEVHRLADEALKAHALPALLRPQA